MAKPRFTDYVELIHTLFDVSGDPSPATSRQIIALQNIAKSSKTDPALAKEITKALNTPTEHNGGPPRVSKSKASEFISQAFKTN